MVHISVVYRNGFTKLSTTVNERTNLCLLHGVSRPSRSIVRENGGLARRHAVALKIEKPGAKCCLGGIASAGWLEDHQTESFSREKLFELCKKKPLLFLTF